MARDRGVREPNPRRLKNSVLLATIVLSGLTLFTWTGQWFTLHLTAAADSARTLVITGDVAAPALIALSLAGLALVAALAIAGPFFRVVLGVLQVLIGFTVALTSYFALTDPVRASTSAITTATGVSGHTSVAALVSSVSQSAWPVAAIALGVLTIALGVFVVVTNRRWPVSSRRYQQTTALEPADSDASAVSDWDTLSGGNDPTSR